MMPMVEHMLHFSSNHRIFVVLWITTLTACLTAEVGNEREYADLSADLSRLSEDTGTDEIRVVTARPQRALCIEHFSHVAVHYRHCWPGENPEAVSLLEVEETINGEGEGSRLGDTDDLFKENLIPELGESNADQVKAALSAPNEGQGDPTEAEEAQKAVEHAQKALDDARKRGENSDVHMAAGKVRSAIHHAVKTAVNTVANANIRAAQKKLNKAKKRLRQVAGLAASPENKKLDEAIGTAKSKVFKLEMELNAASPADKVKVRGDLAIAKAEVQLAEAQKKLHFATDLSKDTMKLAVNRAEAQIKVERANAKLAIAKHELFHATSADVINKAKEDVVASKREVVKAEADAEQFIGPGYAAVQDAKRARQDTELREHKVEILSEQVQANPSDSALVAQLEQAKGDLTKAKELESKAEGKAKKARAASTVTMREKAAQAAQKAEDLKAKLDTVLSTIAKLKGSQNDPAALQHAKDEATTIQKEHRAAVAKASSLANELNGGVSAEVKAVTRQFTSKMEEEQKKQDAQKKAREIVTGMKDKAKEEIEQESHMAKAQSRRDAEQLKSEVTKNLHVLEANAESNAKQIQAESTQQLNTAKTDANKLEQKAEEDAKEVETALKEKTQAAETKEKNLVAEAEQMKEKAIEKLDEAKSEELTAREKSKDTIRQAEGQAEQMKEKEEHKLADEEEKLRKKSATEMQDARQRAETILHRAREAERDHLKGNVGAQGKVSLTGANIIKASQNRYLCMSKTFDKQGHISSFQYMECHKRAKCSTVKGVECKCEEGYTGTGTRCNRVDCGGILPPLNGVVRCPEGTTVGKTCLVSCIDGYILFGPQEHECKENGSYKNIDIKKECRKIDCAVKPAPQNAEMKCSGHAYGDSCTFTCKQGYLLEGSSDVTCQSNGVEKGSWMGNAGETRCKRVDCQAPAVPPKATVNCQGTTFGKKCEFTCDKNSKQQTPQVHVCGEDGKWIGEPVICETLNCETMATPKNGREVCTGTSIGSHCNFICNEGFKRVGAKKRTCKMKTMGTSVTAEWDGSIVSCGQVDCGPHKSVINGKAKCDGSKVGNTCDISCDEGYLKEGPDKRTCQADEKWSGAEPKCKELDCGELEKPDDGTMVCDGTTYLKSCEFACNKGLELAGDSKRVCQKDGFWSGERIFCRVKQCEPLTDPLNGRVNCDGTSFGSSCTHQCNRGYTLEGTGRRFCDEEKKWSGKEVTCTATKCGKPADPSHGSVKCNGESYGNTCTYSCKEGYEISGNINVRRCKSNGYWSGNSVSCKPRDCGKLSTPPDGSQECPKGTVMGTSCAFSCDPGFMLTDEENSKVRTCEKSGEWSGTLAECSPVNCGQPIPPGGAVANCALGTQLHSMCTLQCPAGSRPPGTGKLKCMNDGKWLGDMQCIEVECPEPPRPDYGTISCTGSTVGKACTYGCKKGWNLAGSPIRTCMQSGKWSGAKPKCVPSTCAALLEPPGGKMNCRAANGAFSKTSIRYDASCTVACDYGYNIEGSKERSCKEDGSWSGSAPACLPVDCLPPAAIRGCEHRCEAGTTLGKECTIRGRKGFTLEGGAKEAKISCTGRGQWTPTKAVCVPAECPSLDSMVAGFGKVQCTKKNFRDSKCGLMCNNNLVRSGPRVKECGAGAEWSAGKLECKPIPPKAVEYGGLGDRAPVFTFYSTAGDVSMRLESLGTDARSVYLELQNGKKGSFLKSWMIGMMNNFGLSICYGTPTEMSSSKCPLKIEADGVVHIEGAAYFHDAVKYVQVKEEQRPQEANASSANATNASVPGSSSPKNGSGANSTAAPVQPTTGELGEVQENDQSHEIKLDARLDAQAITGDGELSEAEVAAKKVWWNDDLESLSFLQQSEGAAKPNYHTKVGGEGPQTPAAKWLTENGKIGLRIESQNALEAKNVYLELRNKARRDAWGIGLRKDLNFYAGYGMLDTYGIGSKKNALKVSPSKDVTFMKDVIFYKMPSYFKEGSELDLKGYTAPSTFDAEPSYGKELRLQTQSAVEVPDVPIAADDALGTSASAEPIISYHSKDNLSIRISAESTGSLKEAFLEFRSQKKRAWRLAVHSDGDLYLTFHPSASLKAGEKTIKMTKDGQIHFYGQVLFGSQTLKKF